MLAANEAVARVTRERRLPSLYRVHDQPDEEKLNELREFLATFGLVTGNLARREELVKLLVALGVNAVLGLLLPGLLAHASSWLANDPKLIAEIPGRNVPGKTGTLTAISPSAASRPAT